MRLETERERVDKYKKVVTEATKTYYQVLDAISKLLLIRKDGAL